MMMMMMMVMMMMMIMMIMMMMMIIIIMIIKEHALSCHPLNNFVCNLKGFHFFYQDFTSHVLMIFNDNERACVIFQVVT